MGWSKIERCRRYASRRVVVEIYLHYKKCASRDLDQSSRGNWMVIDRGECGWATKKCRLFHMAMVIYRYVNCALRDDWMEEETLVIVHSIEDSLNCWYYWHCSPSMIAAMLCDSHIKVVRCCCRRGWGCHLIAACSQRLRFQCLRILLFVIVRIGWVDLEGSFFAFHVPIVVPLALRPCGP